MNYHLNQTNMLVLSPKKPSFRLRFLPIFGFDPKRKKPQALAGVSGGTAPEPRPLGAGPKELQAESERVVLFDWVPLVPLVPLVWGLGSLRGFLGLGFGVFFSPHFSNNSLLIFMFFFGVFVTRMK